MSSEHVGGFDVDVPDVANRASITYEFPVRDRTFPPCSDVFDWRTGARCESTTRKIVFVQNNSGKKLVCENDHLQLFDGKPFIPSDEFGPSGEFHNVLPRELQPTDDAILSSRWKIPKEARKRLREESHCARCGATPFPIYATSDTDLLWAWINEYDPDLLAAIQDDLRLKPGVDMREWFFHASQRIKTRIIRRINKSTIEADHGIPRQVANANWHLLPRSSRRFLQRTLLLPLCKKCNIGKGKALIDRDTLIAMYVAVFYDASLPAAVHDARRWKVLLDTLALFYEQRQVS